MVEENNVERRQRAPVVLYQTGFHALKMEIPLFDSQNPRWSVRRCERMFSIYNVAEQQKVTLVAAYLNDVRDAWFQGWRRVKESCIWPEFVEDLCERFRDRGMLDVVEEFNKFKLEGTMQSYQLKFEELKSLMLTLNFTLTEGYFISSFINGLSEDLRPTIKMFQPKTNKQATECAKL